MDACPNCAKSRQQDPLGFREGQSLCINCADEFHERETTMEQEEAGRELAYASRYHAAALLLAAPAYDVDWWGHSHRCPECGEGFACNESGCRAGSKVCQTCEDISMAEVELPAGYKEPALDRSDLDVRNLTGGHPFP